MKTFNVCLLFLFSSLSFADPLAVHGMLLFGDKASYISHLPMFHQPHDYQVIAEVELAEENGNPPLRKYNEAKKQETIFTLVPKPMDLTKVINSKITRFEAVLYQGHFEREGNVELGPLTIKIKKLLIGKKISKSLGASSEFLSFGHNGEYYLAHVIKGSPTYDAIYSTPQPTKFIRQFCGRGGCPEPRFGRVSDGQLPMKLRAEQEGNLSMHPTFSTVGNEFEGQVSVEEPFYAEYNDLAH